VDIKREADRPLDVSGRQGEERLLEGWSDDEDMGFGGGADVEVEKHHNGRSLKEFLDQGGVQESRELEEEAAMEGLKPSHRKVMVTGKGWRRR